ncbi:MAG: response regulator [Bacteriovoracaceae bacterium]|nr:response regulator [Bacteriovoracaceae bacterium]
MSSKKILLVDDEEDILEILVEVISSLGHEVRSGADGVGAVKLYAEFKPDVFLCDTNMPGMSGLDVLKEIKEDVLSRGCKFLFITGEPDWTSSELTEMGAYGFIAKPFELDEIEAKIAELTS